MLRALRLVNTRRNAELSRGYPGPRLAVTYEDDCGWLRERLILWVIKPDKFVVLSPDGDVYDEMRDSWRAAQIMTGRQRCTNGPTDVVAIAEPMENRELIRHITDGRLEGERITAAESLTPAAAPASHRLRGRRATFREETLPLVDTADEVRPCCPIP